jgi:hypothetical protein
MHWDYCAEQNHYKHSGKLFMLVAKSQRGIFSTTRLGGASWHIQGHRVVNCLNRPGNRGGWLV